MSEAELAQLKRIEDKLDRIIHGPESPTVGLAEAMRMTGAKSQTSLYRWLHRKKIRPYSKGRYYREAILSAISRQTIEEQLKR